MLADKLPGKLSVCYFVNSGSEANDLALLIARLYTENFDVIALRNGYHGGSTTTMGLTAHSPWKYNYPHSFGVHHSIAPDPYRGNWGRDDPEAGAKYAADIKNLIDFATPGRVAAFFAESIQGSGARLSILTVILQKLLNMSDKPAGYVYLMKSRRDLAEPVQIIGDSRTRTLFRISLQWPRGLETESLLQL
jgi:4-aminobutyrate aminotransferase-like enzyme